MWTRIDEWIQRITAGGSVRYALLLPLFNAQALVAGVLGVSSRRTSAFDDYHLAALQRMTDVITAATPTGSCVFCEDSCSHPII